MALELLRSRHALARNPLRELLRMERDMEDMLSRAFGDRRGTYWDGETRGWVPPVDVLDLKDEMIVRTDLPGLDQKDIEIAVDNGLMTIRGERKEERQVKDDDYHSCERWSGRFARTLTLPPGVDAEKTTATFKNGVLEIHLHKTKEAASKRIEIRAA